MGSAAFASALVRTWSHPHFCSISGLSEELAESRQMKNSPAPGPLTLLKDSWRQLRAVLGRLLLLTIISQVLLSVIAFPLVRWVFAEALRANGMYAIDLDTLKFGRGFPITVLILILMALLVVMIMILQFGAYMILLRNPHLSWRELAQEVGNLGGKTLRAPSLPLTAYLLIVLPLSGFGFTSAMLHSVAVPNFVTGELAKETTGKILLAVAYTLIGYVNLRLCLTLPIFAFSNEGGTAAIKSSWRETRGLRPWPILVAVVAIVLGLALVSVALFYLILGPTYLADALAPTASPIVAALSYGMAQVSVLVATGLAVAMLAGVLIAYSQAVGAPKSVPPAPGNKGKTSMRVAVGVLAVSALALGIAAIPTMSRVAEHPETIILAHRGWTQGGVENTIEALEAANAVGAEIVEFDTMQTKDGHFVVMHDTELGRLTGHSVKVKDSTLDELTAMTVHADGMSGQIPALVDYVTRANELNQRLLIEIKLSGAETDTHVQDLIDVLAENDLLEGHLFHTLDFESAENLKTLLPDQTVGYIMPFAGFGVPQTLADFLVLEESSATPRMQTRVENAGLGYFVWTVNTDEAIRQRLREGADGIITDHPDWALKARADMDQETGLAGRLHDMMLGFMFPV